MSVRRLAPEPQQPVGFAYTPENELWARAQIEKFPAGRQASAVIPLLWRAQEQHEYWLPRAAIEHVAERLGMPYIRVFEIATFYTMFNLEPVGRHFVQLCGTTPCALRGAGAIRDVLRERIGDQRHVSADGLFSWLEVECLGACCNAPMVQINNDFYEDLTPQSMAMLLDNLAAGRPVQIGSQAGRRSSEAAGGPTSLVDATLYDGSTVGSWRKAFDERGVVAAEAKVAAAKAAELKAAEAKAPPAVAVVGTAPAAAQAKPDAPAPPAPIVEPASIAAPMAAVGATMAATPASTDADLQERAALAATDVGSEAEPTLLAGPREGKADELTLIRGVGPALERMLHGMGFFHFDQIAGWTDEHLRWVDRRLERFKGRARRDGWIAQAAQLATGWRAQKRPGDRPASN